MNAKRHFLVILAGSLIPAIVLLIWATTPATAQMDRSQQGLRIACQNFPPHKIEHPADDLKGLDIEILETVFGDAGWPLTIEYFPFARALRSAQEGLYDANCGCSFSEERAPHFLFSDVMGHIEVGLFTRADGSIPAIGDIVDLEDKTVGVVAGYVLNQELEQAGLVPITPHDNLQAYKMLVAGRFEYLYSYRHTIDYIAHQDGRAGALRFQSLRATPYYFCVSRKAPDAQAIIDRFNSGFRKLMERGTVKDIRRRYFGRPSS